MTDRDPSSKTAIPWQALTIEPDFNINKANQPLLSARPKCAP
jgi:hypothetical protein